MSSLFNKYNFINFHWSTAKYEVEQIEILDIEADTTLKNAVDDCNTLNVIRAKKSIRQEAMF